MKEFADDNFKFHENERKLSKQAENTVGKGEIARYEQFLLFPQCFQKARFPGASKGVIMWEWVNPFPDKTWLLRVCSTILLKTLWETEKLLIFEMSRIWVRVKGQQTVKCNSTAWKPNRIERVHAV